MIRLSFVSSLFLAIVGASFSVHAPIAASANSAIFLHPDRYPRSHDSPLAPTRNRGLSGYSTLKPPVSLTAPCSLSAKPLLFTTAVFQAGFSACSQGTPDAEFGVPLILTVSFTNNLPIAVHDVTIVAAIPVPSEFRWLDPKERCVRRAESFPESDILCRFPLLEPGEHIEVAFSVTPQAVATLDSAATIRANEDVVFQTALLLPVGPLPIEREITLHIDMLSAHGQVSPRFATPDFDPSECIDNMPVWIQRRFDRVISGRLYRTWLTILNENTHPGGSYSANLATRRGLYRSFAPEQLSQSGHYVCKATPFRMPP